MSGWAHLHRHGSCDWRPLSLLPSGLAYSSKTKQGQSKTPPCCQRIGWLSRSPTWSRHRVLYQQTFYFTDTDLDDPQRSHSSRSYPRQTPSTRLRRSTVQQLPYFRQLVEVCAVPLLHFSFQIVLECGSVNKMAPRDLPPAADSQPDPGAENLFRESNIPPLRFAFLCVGSITPIPQQNVTKYS